MAVFSAAIAAVAAVSVATAATAVATISTAIVAVSAAVGVAGLAVTAVGMITKNEDLLKAGKIMGYVGAAGGLLGGAVGGFGAMATGASGGSFMQGAADAYAGYSQILEKSWNEGVGSWFSSGAEVANGGSGGAVASHPGTTVETAPNFPSTSVTSPTAPVGGPALPAPTSPADMSKVAQPATEGVVAASPSSPTINISGTPGVQASTPPVVSTPEVPVLSGANPIPGYAGAGATPIPGAGAGDGANLLGGVSDWWKNVPDWAKMSMMTTGGQGVAGLASGYFTGLSAEESLKQRQLENQQAQDQIQLLNRQGSYAPLIQFRRPS